MAGTKRKRTDSGIESDQVDQVAMPRVKRSKTTVPSAAKPDARPASRKAGKGSDTAAAMERMADPDVAPASPKRTKASSCCGERSSKSAVPPVGGLACGADGRMRCYWVGGSGYEEYHDTVWGQLMKRGAGGRLVLNASDRLLFEYLSYGVFQCGLSWRIVWGKRVAFRQAFFDFDRDAIASMSDGQLNSLLESDSGIIRNKVKVFATRSNAQALGALAEEFGSFGAFLESYFPNGPIRAEMATTTSDVGNKMATVLKRRGFKFMGPFIVHAFLQMVGLINSHVPGCTFGGE